MSFYGFRLMNQALPKMLGQLSCRNTLIDRSVLPKGKIMQFSGPIDLRMMSSVSGSEDSSKTLDSSKDSAKGIDATFINRNPRNLEEMGLAWKRKGWRFQYPSREYYHRLIFEKTNRQIVGHVEHCSGEKVLSVSSNDLAIARHLYSATDVSAARNVGRLLAYQCLQAGITSVTFQPLYNNPASVKMKAFCDAMRDGGIALEEMEEIKPEYSPGIDYDDREAVEDLERRQLLVYQLSEESQTNLRLKQQRHQKTRRRPWRRPERLEIPQPTFY